MDGEPPTAPSAGQPGSPTGPSALCAAHPDQPADAICERCGNYMCLVCSDYRLHAMCASCRTRLGLVSFPYARDRWSIDDLFGYAWHVFKREWSWLVVAMLLFGGIVYSIAFAFQIVQAMALAAMPGDVESELGLGVTLGSTIVSSLLQAVVQGWLQLGLFVMFIDALNGVPVRIATLFGQWRKIGKVVVQWLVMMGVFAAIAAPAGVGVYFFFQQGGLDSPVLIAVVVIVGLLLTVAGAYVGLGIVFMQTELAHDDAVGAIEAIGRSWVIARGQRWWILLVGVLAYVLTVLGIVACCVGILATGSLAGLLFTGLYLALRNGAEVPPPVHAERSV